MIGEEEKAKRVKKKKNAGRDGNMSKRLKEKEVGGKKADLPNPQRMESRSELKYTSH
jgi:hypothetical protein